jgi:hypothetical protein
VCAAAAGPGRWRGCREREYLVGYVHGSFCVVCGERLWMFVCELRCVKATRCLLWEAVTLG